MSKVIVRNRPYAITLNMDRESVRDHRSPVPLNEHTVKSMRGNVRKDTKPEMELRRLLREAGYTGYRLQWKVPGRPDICYPGRKVAIFVNGCFWHRCPICNLPMPKNNREFWEAKFSGNVERDRRNIGLLEADGWHVIVVWECEIKKDPEGVIDRILATNFLDRSKV